MESIVKNVLRFVCWGGLVWVYQIYVIRYLKVKFWGFKWFILCVLAGSWSILIRQIFTFIALCYTTGTFVWVPQLRVFLLFVSCKRWCGIAEKMRKWCGLNRWPWLQLFDSLQKQVTNNDIIRKGRGCIHRPNPNWIINAWLVSKTFQK